MTQSQIIEKFKQAFRKFPQNYQVDFDTFWLWKIKTESRTEHILDTEYLDRTFNRLSPILKGWQYNRGPNIDQNPLENLKLALKNISEEYNEIRNLSLLDIEQFEIKPIQRIWEEFGNVKVNKTNEEIRLPLVISICKPLMLIWGQTLAFDTKVRGSYYKEYKFSFLRKNRWSLNEWLYSLFLSYSLLEKNDEFKKYLKKCSIKKYGDHSLIPYGRLLDIYYF